VVATHDVGDAAGGRPCAVGLTGGLASGKSTVARMLATRGAPHLDADHIVHELYATGGDGAAAVSELFGEKMLAAEGGVDRERLGRMVLADPEARDALERAIHPLVRREVSRWLVELGARTDPPEVAIVEAALLVETGAARGYDLLAVVWCRPEQQLERALARGVPAARARGLLAAQMPIDAKRAAADVVIDNSGPESALTAEVVRAWEEIVARCRSRQTSAGSSHSV
jgi:dephospho-CoA kinase